MAERRMFAKTIIDSDAFLDMPLSTQALYFHLAMRADDDGFLNSPKKVMRMVGASEDELKVLLGKKFLMSFESGVIVIKHWKMHNYIRKDRYKETMYLEEKSQLIEKSNGSYTIGQPLGQPESNQRLTQVRVGKVRLGKDSKDIEELEIVTDETYRKFKHLELSTVEYERLLETGYKKSQIDEQLDAIENYAKNKNYTSLNLTVRKWLKKQYGSPAKAIEEIDQSMMDFIPGGN